MGDARGACCDTGIGDSGSVHATYVTEKVSIKFITQDTERQFRVNMAKSKLELASCPTPQSIDKFVHVLKAEFEIASIVETKVIKTKNDEPENTNNAETKQEKKAEAKATKIVAKAVAASVSGSASVSTPTVVQNKRKGKGDAEAANKITG